MVFDWLQMAILLFFAVGLLMAGVSLIVSYFLSPKSKDPQMGIPYECGMVPLNNTWVRFHMNYYIYALIFLAFEVDVLYLFPVALFYPLAQGLSAFLKVFLFLLVIASAVLFFWAKGVFEWPRKIK